MQGIRWIALGISNALTRTVVHFFPSEGGVTAPYQANCTLRVFGHGLQEKKIMLEGARLSHPDGVRIEDAFPEVQSNQVGIFGIEIELTSLQPRVDLSGSSVIIELASKGHSAKYWPALIDEDGSRSQSDMERIAREIRRNKASQAQQQLAITADGAEAATAAPSEEEKKPELRTSLIPLVHDAFNVSSVVVVNGSKEGFALSLRSAGQELVSEPFAPLSAIEKQLDEKFYEGVLPRECSWGLFRARGLQCCYEKQTEPRAGFLVLRDALTRRPVSVCAL